MSATQSPNTSGGGPRVLSATREGVTTITMNRPRRLNGWTMDMLADLKAALAAAAGDDATRAVILTGTGRYYCAGVNLGGSLQLGHPRALHEGIVAHNRALFDTFLDFPKPILVAANGPAIGAAVTAATLCDGIVAAPGATFSTPFAALSITPEGCSSVLFERMMGPANAERMLGREGWRPNAEQACEAGLIGWVASDDQLLAKADEIVRGWLDEGRGKRFSLDELAELKAVNARESIGVADSFLSAPFMKAQFKFLWGKGKRAPAAMFLGLWATRPLWSRLL